MTYQTYIIAIENLKNITLEHARVSFLNNEAVEIDYEYDENIDNAVKREAEYFDRLTYTF